MTRIRELLFVSTCAAALTLTGCGGDDGSGQTSGDGDGDGDPTGDGDGDGDFTPPSFGEPIQVSQVPEGHDATYVELEPITGGYLLLWSRGGDDLPDYQTELHVSRLAHDGSLVWDQALVGTNAGVLPKALAVAGSTVGVAYSADSALWLARLDLDGNEQGSRISLSDLTGLGGANYLDMVSDGQGFAVVQAEDSPTFYTLAADGTLDVAPWAVAAPIEATGEVSLAWNGGEYGLAWTDANAGQRIRFARIAASGDAVTGSVVEVTDQGAIPSLAAADDGWGIAWVDYRDHGITNTEVYFGRLAADGTRLGTDQRASTSGYAFGPRLAWDGSSFALVWYVADPSAALPHVDYAELDEAGQLLGRVALFDTFMAYPYPVIRAGHQGWAMAWADAVDGRNQVHFATE